MTAGQDTQPAQPTITHLFSKQKPFPTSSDRAVTISKAIAEYVLLDMKPLDTVDGVGFKQLINVLEPRYTVISRNHLLERYIVPMYQEAVEYVKLELSKGIRHAFTTDGWTSLSTESFITTTCHYIEPQTFTLHSIVLDTKYCPVSHTAENLAKEMETSIVKWNLKDPVSVTDNAANIVKACDLAKLPHIGCFGHTLNLAVNRCLSISEVSALLGKCRKLVSVFKQSSLKTSALHTAEVTLELQQLQVLQDVETRWNSALGMISRLLEILPAIWTVLYKDKKYVHLLPSDTDRKNMEDLKELLHPVEEATEKVSAEKYSTVSLILPTMERFIKHDFVPKPNDSSLIVKAKDAVRTDLLKRYNKDDEQALLLRATVLDPRFKRMQWLGAENREKVYSQLKQDMLKTKVKSETESAVSTEVYSREETATSEESNSVEVDEPASEEVGAQSSPEKKKLKKSCGETEENADFFDVLFVKEEKSKLTKLDMITREFDGYMKEEVTFKVHPILWWRINRDKYPLLAQMAMKYLHIPATSVPSERVFSTAGNILTKKRSSLTAENADMLVFLNKNYKKLRQINITAPECSNIKVEAI